MEKEQNEKLERLVALRTVELNNANEQLKTIDKAKSDILKIISHELRTPLNGLGIAEYLFSNHNLTKAERKTYEKHYRSAYRRLLSMIDNALILTQLSSHSISLNPNRVLFHDLVRASISEIENWDQIGEMDEKSCDVNDVTIVCDLEFTLKAISEIFATAVRFSSRKKPVSVSCRIEDENVVLQVKSWGFTVPEKYLGCFFIPLSIPESLFPGGDIGLAPSVAHQVIILQKGQVEIENHDEQGIQFRVTLPRIQQEGRRLKPARP